MNQDAQRYLAEQLSSARVPPPKEDTEDWQDRTFSRFSAALEALRAVNTISDEESHDWSNRMLVALGHEPLAPLPQRFAGPRRVSFQTEEPPPPVPRFLGLIPVTEPDRPLPSGGRLQILGIERYETKVVVVWRVAPLPDFESMYADEFAALDQDIEGLSELERRTIRERFRHSLHPISPVH